MARLPWRRFCRRCGAEIATANLMDADPGVDREHFSLFLQGGQRRQLSPAEWRLFTALYQRHGRIVPLAELATATRNAAGGRRHSVIPPPAPGPPAAGPCVKKTWRSRRSANAFSPRDALRKPSIGSIVRTSPSTSVAISAR